MDPAYIVVVPCTGRCGADVNMDWFIVMAMLVPLMLLACCYFSQPNFGIRTRAEGFV